MKIRWLCCGDCESDQHHWIWEISLIMFDSDWTVKRTRELALCGELFLFSLFACTHQRRFRYYLSLAGAATSINFFVTRQFCCCDKHVFVVTNTWLSWQNTSFVAKKVCLSQQNYFCSDKKLLFLSLQAYFCCDKRRVLSRQKFCLDKHTFVAKKRRVLLQQTHACHDKHVFVARQNFRRDKNYT